MGGRLSLRSSLSKASQRSAVSTLVNARTGSIKEPDCECLGLAEGEPTQLGAGEAGVSEPEDPIDWRKAPSWTLLSATMTDLRQFLDLALPPRDSNLVRECHALCRDFV